MDARIAKMELASMQTEALRLDRTDIFTFLINKGLSKEIVTRLLQLWDLGMDIGKKGIAIGKIILKVIIDFVAQHPTMAVGMTIGALLSMFTSSLVDVLPESIADFLNSIILFIFVSIGAIAGHLKDKYEIEGISPNPASEIGAVINTLGDGLNIIKEFLALIIDIIRSAYNAATES